MSVDRVTGEVREDDGGEHVANAEDVGNNVTPLRSRHRQDRERGRRSTVSTSTSDGDAKALVAQSRIIEVQDASDRLGLSELRTTLSTSETARRGLTKDIIDLQARHDIEVGRIRDEYEDAADAAERRHHTEYLRWQAEREGYKRDIERLTREVEDAKKAKKKAKKNVAELEIQLTKLREAGLNTRAVVGLLAPGVPPLAQEAARHLPNLFAYLRNVIGQVPGVSASEPEEAVQDRAAALRFAGRLFDPRNRELLEELEGLAFNVVDDGSGAVVVNEWDRVRRYVWSTISAAPPSAEGSDGS